MRIPGSLVYTQSPVADGNNNHKRSLVCRSFSVRAAPLSGCIQLDSDGKDEQGTAKRFRARFAVPHLWGAKRTGSQGTIVHTRSPAQMSQDTISEAIGAMTVHGMSTGPAPQLDKA